MNDSAFNPDAFLSAQVSEVNEKRPPLPVENPEPGSNGFYTAVISGVQMKSGTINNGERAGQPWLCAVLPLKIEVPQQLQDAMGYPPTVTLTDRAFLDLTPDGRGLDNGKGKNRAQRMYREALDLNKPGDVWSWAKAEGQPVRVKVAQEVYQGEIQEKVGGVFRRS